jgi:hypothetical protein
MYVMSSKVPEKYIFYLPYFFFWIFKLVSPSFLPLFVLPIAQHVMEYQLHSIDYIKDSSNVRKDELKYCLSSC